MQFLTIDDARENIGNISKGDRVAFLDKEGKIRIGTVRMKKGTQKKGAQGGVFTNLYIYAQYRTGKKVTEKYIGKWFSYDKS